MIQLFISILFQFFIFSFHLNVSFLHLCSDILTRKMFLSFSCNIVFGIHGGSMAVWSIYKLASSTINIYTHKVRILKVFYIFYVGAVGLDRSPSPGLLARTGWDTSPASIPSSTSSIWIRPYCPKLQRRPAAAQAHFSLKKCKRCSKKCKRHLKK